MSIGEISGGFSITGLFGKASDVGPGELNVANGNESHQSPVADQQAGANSDQGARFEEAKEQAGKEIGESNAIEDAEEAHVGPGFCESAGIKQTDDVEQNATANDTFDDVCLPGAFDGFGQREDNRDAYEKYEERKNQIVEMKSLPIDVFELIGEEVGGFARAETVQSVNERVGADDPEHVEAAQCIYGHEALSLDSGLRLSEFLGRGRRGGQSCH